jgi:hypothetical protein
MTLSLERAEAMCAYLQDKVDLWLERYESTVAQNGCRRELNRGNAA